jgi:hypothetical protein
MDNDEVQRSIGELKGMITANHAENTANFKDLREEVKTLQNLHQRMKGAMTMISLLVVGGFHIIVESVKAKLINGK